MCLGFFFAWIVLTTMNTQAQVSQTSTVQEERFALTKQDTALGVFRVIAINQQPFDLRLFQILRTGQSFTVEPKIYMVLLHRNGSTVEIHKAGNYRVNVLENQLLNYTQKKSLKPVNLVIHNKNQSVNESVYFNSWPYRCPEPEMGILSPEKNLILSNSLDIAWYNEHKKKSKYYEVIITNTFEDEYQTKKVKGESVHLTLPPIDDSVYLVKVKIYDGDYMPVGCTTSIMLDIIKDSEIRPTYHKFKAITKYNQELVADIQEVVFWMRREFSLEARKTFRRLAKKYVKHPVIPNAFKHFETYYRFVRVSDKKEKKKR